MTRVAILVKEFPPNVTAGTETQTLRMARELQTGSVHEVTVYTKRYTTNTVDEMLDIVRIPNIQKSPFLSTLTFVLLAFIYLLRDHRRFDLLHCMMIYPNGFIGYVLNRVVPLPYFAWIRGGDYYFMKDHPVKCRMIRRVLNDGPVLVQTEGIRREVLEEFPEADLRVVGNGVEIPENTADGDNIVYVGRLHEQKGVDVLLHAMSGLDETLLVVGDGPERSDLEALATSLNIDAEFVGEVPAGEVNDYLLRGKVFVLPSVQGEGLPNAVLEAMAVGLPVVATDTGGVSDVIKEAETGYVVEPGSQQELRNRLREVCRDEEHRERLGRNARQYVEKHHAWPVIIDDLTAFYKSIVGSSAD